MEPKPQPNLLHSLRPAALASVVASHERHMALLKRELYRRTTGPDITHADVWALVFDTDTKSLYVEHDEAHLEARIGGDLKMAISRMEIADYLRCRGQTAGHRELWRLLRTMFDDERVTDDSPA